MPERTSEIELPILHEIGERLYAAAVTADAQRTTVSRMRQCLLGTRGARGRLIVAVVALAAAGGAGGLALAGDLGAINPQAWVNGDRVAPAPRVTQAQDTSLGILRRAHLSSDALDDYDGHTFTDSPAAASGANIALARRAHGFKDGAAWVIPGNGVICLITENAQGLREVNPSRPGARPHHLPGAAGGGSCAATAIVEKGWSAGASLEGGQGMTFTSGIVPDRVSHVTVLLWGGGSVSLPVHENVYMGTVHGQPMEVLFTGPSGTVNLGLMPREPNGREIQRCAKFVRRTANGRTIMTRPSPPGCTPPGRPRASVRRR